MWGGRGLGDSLQELQNGCLLHRITTQGPVFGVGEDILQPDPSFVGHRDPGFVDQIEAMFQGLLLVFGNGEADVIPIAIGEAIA